MATPRAAITALPPLQDDKQWWDWLFIEPLQRWGRKRFVLCETALISLLTFAAHSLIVCVTDSADAMLHWQNYALPLILPALLTPLFILPAVMIVDQLHRVTDGYRYLAQHDQLTGAMNRHGLFALEVRPRTMVVLADVDGFKQVNDEYGHQVGDAVLIAVADLLRDLLGQDTAIARLGGDEFVALVPPESIISVPEDLLASAMGQEVLVSVGIAAMNHNLDDALLEADRAMYLAKNRARARRSARA